MCYVCERVKPSLNTVRSCCVVIVGFNHIIRPTRRGIVFFYASRYSFWNSLILLTVSRRRTEEYQVLFVKGVSETRG